jgi:hypothetical protein
LCVEIRPLCKSHIIPKFVFRWLKTSGNTRAIRHNHSEGGDSVAGRLTKSALVQDGASKYLLCNGCEEKISVWERAFHLNVFVPVHRGAPVRPPEMRPIELEYGKWLPLFCASLVWRILVVAPTSYEGKPPETFARDCARAERKWRRFLTGESPGPGRHELHLMPALSHDHDDRRGDRYLSQIVQYTCAAHPTSGEAYVIAKLGWLVMIGVIGNPQPTLWLNTKIHTPKGVWSNHREIAVSSTVLDFMVLSSANVDDPMAMMFPRTNRRLPLRVQLRPSILDQ